MECCTLCRADLKAPAPGVSFIFAIKGLPFTFPFKAVNSTCSDLPEHPGSRESKGRNRISQPWLGLWFLGEHPAAQDVTLLLSPHHRPQVTAHQEHWQQHIPLPSLSAPCLQLPPKGTWELQELLPRSSLEHKTLYLLCRSLWQWPLGTPSPATCAALGQSSQEEEARKRKKEIKASHSNRNSINQKLFLLKIHPPSKGIWG